MGYEALLPEAYKALVVKNGETPLTVKDLLKLSARDLLTTHQLYLRADAPNLVTPIENDELVELIEREGIIHRKNGLGAYTLEGMKNAAELVTWMYLDMKDIAP